MNGCDGEKLLEFKGWTISVTRVVDLFVNVIFIIQKQTNIIFIFHIFKITYTFASFSATETSSTNDDILYVQYHSGRTLLLWRTEITSSSVSQWLHWQRKQEQLQKNKIPSLTHSTS